MAEEGACVKWREGQFLRRARCSEGRVRGLEVYTCRSAWLQIRGGRRCRMLGEDEVVLGTETKRQGGCKGVFMSWQEEGNSRVRLHLQRHLPASHR